ncbi:MAG: alpha-galactosidase [Chloroflexi bacterium]|nr:alpha-galactosidase [Chloroflexota bacterium]
MEDQVTAYANFKQYSIRYDLERNTFSYWYTPRGLVLEDAKVAKVVIAGKVITLNDYSTAASSMFQQDDATVLSVTYENGPAPIKEFDIRFLVSDTGITCFFVCPGDSDVYVDGQLCWGGDMEHETFAVNLNRPGQDLRCAHGPASSVIDNALFDRRTDSAIEIDGCTTTRITYDWDKSAYRFTLHTMGDYSTTGFRARVYERVIEDKFNVIYKPINPHTTFQDPPVGWMTWYSVQFDASEDTVLENARWQAKNLKDYGANTIWVDWEWYHGDFTGQQKPDTDSFHPDTSKYPKGLKYLASQIKKLGFVPAIWVGATNDPTENEFIQAHPETVLVHKPQWCGQYFMDLTHPLYLEQFIPQFFKQIMDWGYEALKWDCLPTTIQLCDMYHDRFYNPNLSTEQAMLGAVSAARNVVGPNFYMLYCCGLSDRDFNIAAAGFDGARIGGDIFKWEDFISYCIAKVMKLYALHNVVFLNDPDNVVLRPKFNTYDQALSRLNFVSLLGLPITLGDNLPELPEDRVELLRRGIPSLTTHPMDLRKTAHDYTVVKVNLAVNKPYEQWNIVDVFNLLDKDIETTVDIYDDLHLPLDEGPYLVYDYWNKEYIGAIARRFTVQLRPFASRVFAVRRKLEHPQVLSTSRHISQGAYDITSLTWDAAKNTLSGISKVVAGDPYDILLYVPDPYMVFVEGNATLSTNLKNIGKNLWMFHLEPSATGEEAWSVAFTPVPPH